MRRGEDSLTALRQDAHGGVAALTALLDAGRLMGVAVPSNESVRAGMTTIDSFDIASLSADSRVLVSACRAVSEQLHHMPEQRVRLDDGWNSESATAAIGSVIDHQRRAESDLHILRTLTDATAAAASGIDRLLRSSYLAIARLSAPTVAGTPPAELPQAVLSGKVPMAVAVEDIRSRVDLFTSCVDTVTAGISGIIEILNRSIQGMDDDPYPVTSEEAPRTDVRPAPPAPALIDTAPLDTTPLDTTPTTEPVAVRHTVSEGTAFREVPTTGEGPGRQVPPPASPPVQSAAAPSPPDATPDPHTVQTFRSAVPVPAPDDGDVPFRLGGATGLSGVATGDAAGSGGPEASRLSDTTGVAGETASMAERSAESAPTPQNGSADNGTGPGRHRRPTATPSAAGSDTDTSTGDSEGELALAGEQ